jgi:hypothetical protein
MILPLGMHLGASFGGAAILIALQGQLNRLPDP